MKIVAIETGKVKITKKWRHGDGDGLRRLMNTLFDKTFTDWLPIYCWLIEHPEGLIVIDTGIPADANKPIYFPPFMPLVQRAAQFQMAPELEIGVQLREMGYRPDEVRWVMQTHLHQDHDGGLHHFPKATILVSRAEWAAAAGLKGRLGGYLNQRWPEELDPYLIDFSGPAYGPFDSHFTLTEAGDVIIVPTPGHSAGHISVILRHERHAYFFAGDASYTEEIMQTGHIDGVAVDPLAQLDTQARIRSFVAAQPTIYLPSHDPGAAARLARLETAGSPQLRSRVLA